MSSSLRKKPSGTNIVLKSAAKIRIGIAVSEWHPEITEALFEGAVSTLVKNGIKKENIIRKNAPGSFELVLTSLIMLRKYKVNAAICLGCVIKGETDHYNYICSAVSKGIMDISLSSAKPVGFGVLTTDTMEQAFHRAGGKFGNKGEESALAVLKMLSI